MLYLAEWRKTALAPFPRWKGTHCAWFARVVILSLLRIGSSFERKKIYYVSGRPSFTIPHGLKNRRRNRKLVVKPFLWSARVVKHLRPRGSRDGANGKEQDVMRANLNLLKILCRVLGTSARGNESIRVMLMGWVNLHASGRWLKGNYSVSVSVAYCTVCRSTPQICWYVQQ